MFVIWLFVLWCGMCYTAELGLAQAATPNQTATVGFPGRIEQLVLPGSELMARPIEDRQQPVVVRIENTFPHGSNFRYDLSFVGLEPGTFDLREYLVRKDGTSTENLPSIPVTVNSVIPAGAVRPNELASAPTGFGSYYVTTILVLGMLWLFGLLALLFGRRVKEQELQRQKRVVTVAERLKPLVQRAALGQLNRGERAELERILIQFWRDRLNVKELPADKLIKYLKQHEEAGVLLRQLETWLHDPRSVGDRDVGEFLKPYEQMVE
jgi:hypothetical protein